MTDPAPASPAETAKLEDSPAGPVSARSDWRNREIGLAVRNALKLGGSLIFTWGIALVMRLYIPRFLGPDRFGELNFADAFTAAAFVVLGLGMDPYVRKEIAVRPQHANDFVGGVIAVRVLMLVVVYGVMELVLRITNRNEEVRRLVYIYGIAQFFVVGSSTSAGLLHAVGKVNELSLLSILTKFVWAGGLILAIVLRMDLWAFAAALALSEGLKSFILFRLARKHLKLEVQIHVKATWAAIVASLPFYFSGIAATVSNRIDVSILAVQSTDREVGWYGAAAGFASIAMFLTPLINWVLIPLFSRAAAASEAELCSMIRRSLEFILTLTIPVSLMMIVGAHVFISMLFGEPFAPASSALRILAITCVLMYVSIVYWCALTMLNRTWPVTLIMASGLIVNPICNLLFIPRGLEWLGAGGGGTACALSGLITEIVIVGSLFVMLGRKGFDSRLVNCVLRTLAVIGVVIAADMTVLRPMGPWRIVVEGVLYAVLVVVSGAADIRGMVTWTTTALKRRKEPATKPA